MDPIFSDTFHSSPPLAKIVCQQYFLGGHNVDKLVFGTQDGKSIKESEILPDRTPEGPIHIDCRINDTL